MDFTFEDDNRTLPSRTRKRGLSSPTIIESPKKVARQRVATSSMDVDFDRPVERRRGKAPARINYLGRSEKKSLIRFKPKLNIVTLVWLAFIILTLRLVFMDRGVADFYEKEDLIKSKQAELKRLEQSNIQIIDEIEKIKTVPSYQKRLAREHLGVIAKDEYLILFSKEGKAPSI